jgi:hypothetical protein
LKATATARQRLLYFAWVALSIALGLALRWRAVEASFLADDYDHYAMHEGLYPVKRGPLDMFDFVGDSAVERHALLRSGRLPWWSAPELHLSVLRPLASALIALDFSLFGPDPKPLHLHSMLWWAVLVSAVAAVLARVLPLPGAAVGVLIYALDEAHGLTLSWIANRSALVAAALCAWGLWAHLAHRAGELRYGRALSACLVALGLLAGEHAFAVLGYFAAFELWAMRDSPRRRALALLPVAALAGCYLIARGALGYGIAGSGFYIDPLATPLRYAASSAVRLPLLLGDLVLGFGAEWYYVGPPWRSWLLGQALLPARWLSLPVLQGLQLGAGLATTVGLCALLWWLGRSARGHRTPAARWLLLGALLSLAPMCSTLAMSRLTLGAAIGVDGVLGLLLWSALRAALQAKQLVPRVQPLLLALPLLGVHVAYAAVRAHDEVAYYFYRSRVEESWAMHAELDDAGIATKHVMVIAARDWTSQWGLSYARRLHGHPMPKSTELLSAALDNRHTLVRISERVLELDIDGPAQPETFSGGVYRPEDAPFRGGERLACAHLEVLVLSASRGQPTRLLFTFPLSVDDDRYVFLYPGERGLARVAPPAIGQRLSLPPPAWPTFVQP